MKYLLSLLFFFAFVPACSPRSVPTDPNPTRTLAGSLIQHQAQNPTVLATLSPEVTPTTKIPPTQTAKPSVTPTPTLTPSPIPTPCRQSGRVITGQFYSNIAGQPLPYRIYLPPCYGQDGHTYPSLYMLHGSPNTDLHWDDLGLDEAAETGILDGLLPPLLIVMPGGGTIAQNSSGGPNSFEAVIVKELTPFIETSYCAAAGSDYRAIGGVSRGGYWALEIAFRFPHEYASVGGHSAALLDTFAGSDINPQFTGLTNDLGDLRIYLDIGAEDWVINNIRRLHEDMVTAGVTHTWVLNQGKHEDYYWTENLAEYLAWYTVPWSMERESFPPCLIE